MRSASTRRRPSLTRLAIRSRASGTARSRRGISGEPLAAGTEIAGDALAVGAERAGGSWAITAAEDRIGASTASARRMLRRYRAQRTPGASPATYFAP